MTVNVVTSSALAELLSLNTAMRVQHSELAATIARTQKLIAKLAVDEVVLDTPASRRIASQTARREKILELYAAGHSQKEIAQIIDTTWKAVGQILARARKAGDSRGFSGRFAKEGIVRILAMAAEGRSAREIAEATGFKFARVNSALYRARKRDDAKILTPETPRVPHVPRPQPKPEPVSPKLVSNAVLSILGGTVRGPLGSDGSIPEIGLAALRALASGNLHATRALADAAGVSPATARYTLAAMRSRLAAIGVAVVEGPKDFWSVRRLGE